MIQTYLHASIGSAFDKDKMNPSAPLPAAGTAPAEQKQYSPAIDYTKNLTRYSAARYTIEVCTKLNTNVLTTATALSYFHSFYRNATFEDYDPFTIGCTCIYLASKVVDDDVRIRDIINVGLNTIKRNAPPLMLEPYFTMRDSLCQAELLLMRILGFKLKMELPHKFLLHYLSALEDWLGRDTFDQLPAAKIAWSLLQDAYHDPLVIDRPPEVVATACIHMALELHGVTVPSEEDPWYSVLHAGCTKEAVTEVAFEIFELYSKEDSLQVDTSFKS